MEYSIPRVLEAPLSCLSIGHAGTAAATMYARLSAILLYYLELILLYYLVRKFTLLLSMAQHYLITQCYSSVLRSLTAVSLDSIPPPFEASSLFLSTSPPPPPLPSLPPDTLHMRAADVPPP